MSALSLLFFIKDVFLIEFLIYNTECFTTEILLNISYCFGKSALISEILLEFFQSRFDVTALIRDLSVQSAAGQLRRTHANFVIKIYSRK